MSVPVRIKPGRAYSVVKAGNHTRDPDGRFRYMRLAEQTGVAERFAAMLRGDHINTTEDRAVLHTALRRPPGASPVTSIASKRGIRLVNISSARMLGQSGFMAGVFEAFRVTGTKRRKNSKG